MKTKLLNTAFPILLALSFIANLYSVIFTANIALEGLSGKYGISLFSEIRRTNRFEKWFELGPWTGIHPFFVGIFLGIIAVAVIALYGRELNTPVKALLIANPFLTALSVTEFFFTEFSVSGLLSGNPFPYYSVIAFAYPALFLALPIAITVLAVRDRKAYARL